MKIGCAGFGEAKGKYFREFNVVEVQQTFYRPVPLDTLKRWREEAPVGFEFTLKALQVITHPPHSPTYRRYRGPRPGDAGFFRPVKPVMEAWETTLKEAEALEAKIIIFQLPPSFCPESQNLENMARFFSSVKTDGLSLGIELRCKEWKGKVEELCREFGLFHVVDPFSWERECGEVKYFRLHGKGGYRYRFTEEDFSFLKEISDRDTYIIFNNIYALEDARRFKDFII